MRDILISSAVCVGCLMLALVSQIVAPTPAQASAPAASEVRPAAKAAAVNPAAPPAELDPNESNPRLFAMAPEASDQSPKVQQLIYWVAKWKPAKSA